MPRSILLGFLLASLVCSRAKADEHHTSLFEVLATGDSTRPTLINSTSSNATFSSAIGYGGGVIYGQQLQGSIYLRSIFLEGGAFFSRRKWDDSVTGQQTLGVIEAPLFFNIRMASFLSINLGGYYALNNFSSRVSYINNQDYGVLGGLEITVPFTQQRALVFGVNYLNGLSNVSNAGGNLALKDVQVYAGLRFGRMGLDTFFPSW
jgi:hypothetical protein